MEVVLYDALLQSNDSTADSSYHLHWQHRSGRPCPFADRFVGSAEPLIPAPLQAALLAGEHFTRLYANGARQGAVRAIEPPCRRPCRGAFMWNWRVPVWFQATWVHAGDTIQVEATASPLAAAGLCNVRIAITLPARLGEGNLRLLVSDAGTLDRAQNPPQFSGRQRRFSTF